MAGDDLQQRPRPAPARPARTRPCRARPDPDVRRRVRHPALLAAGITLHGGPAAQLMAGSALSAVVNNLPARLWAARPGHRHRPGPAHHRLGRHSLSHWTGCSARSSGCPPRAERPQSLWTPVISAPKTSCSVPPIAFPSTWSITSPQTVRREICALARHETARSANRGDVLRPDRGTKSRPGHRWRRRSGQRNSTCRTGSTGTAWRTLRRSRRTARKGQGHQPACARRHEVANCRDTREPADRRALFGAEQPRPQLDCLVIFAARHPADQFEHPLGHDVEDH